MMRSFSNLFQSYAFDDLSTWIPAIHDLSCHDKVSLLVKRPLRSPFSKLARESYSALKTESGCMIRLCGYRVSHSLSVDCIEGISLNVCPLRRPATASPVSCLHQLFVVMSSNIAL